MPKKKYIKRPFPRKGVDWKQMRAKKKLEQLTGGVDCNCKSDKRLADPLPSRQMGE